MNSTPRYGDLQLSAGEHSRSQPRERLIVRGPSPTGIIAANYHNSIRLSLLNPTRFICEMDRSTLQRGFRAGVRTNNASTARSTFCDLELILVDPTSFDF